MPWYGRPDGCRLYYELYGPEEGAPLILLEGLGGDIPGWRRNIPHLAERYRVIAYAHSTVSGTFNSTTKSYHPESQDQATWIK